MENIINAKNLVNGKLVTTKNKALVYEVNTNNIIGQVPVMSTKDVDVAMSSAKEAFLMWSSLSLKERISYLLKAADILEKNAQSISEILIKEVAKPRNDSLNEVIRTAELIRYTCEIALSNSDEILYGSSYEKNNVDICIAKRVPIGVVLCIVPYNYPINLAGSKIAPALVSGNTVVIKPATPSCLSTLALVNAFAKAGIPAGVLNSVTGKGSVIGDYLTSHEAVNFINFTGSSPVGKHMTTVAGMKALLFELGGKDAALVLNDADLEKTAEQIVKGAFSYSGQRCTAIKRVLVQSEIKEQLTALIVEKVNKLTIGNASDNCAITPLVDKWSAKNFTALYEDAKQKGATMHQPLKVEGSLCYPVVASNVSLDANLAWEEPFAPILPIITCNTIEEMIKINNKSEYGLQASIFTKNVKLANEIALKLEVGSIHINYRTQRGPDNFPFLGVKDSGIGVQGIRFSIESMTRLKAIISH